MELDSIRGIFEEDQNKDHFLENYYNKNGNWNFKNALSMYSVSKLPEIQQHTQQFIDLLKNEYKCGSRQNESNKFCLIETMSSVTPTCEDFFDKVYYSDFSKNTKAKYDWMLQQNDVTEDFVRYMYFLLLICELKEIFAKKKKKPEHSCF